jgi:hypothetical protein
MIPKVPLEKMVEETRREADEAARAGSLNPAWSAFLAFMAENLGQQDVNRGIDAKAVRNLRRMAERCTGVDAALRGITPRALSISLYGDTGYLEKLLGLFKPVASRARRRKINVPEFSPPGRPHPETFIAGKIQAELTGETPGESAPALVNALGNILGLPQSTVRRIKRITPIRDTAIPRVLLIENRETFYALAEHSPEYDCVLFTAGHPSASVRTLIALLVEADFDFCFAGDLDPEGIQILQELADIAGKPVTPVNMDRNIFDRYLPAGLKLGEPMLRRLSHIRDETLSLPGIGGLVKRIRETGFGVEQDIVDYT